MFTQNRPLLPAAALATCGALALLLAAAPVRATSVTSTVSEDNGATHHAGQGTQADQAIYDGPVNHPAIVNTVSGYNFTGANSYLNLNNISQITFTMTMQDGDTGAGNFDVGHLSLYLAAPSAMTYNATTGVVLTGGVNTSIVLNGFRGNGFQDTNTFTLSINSGTVGAAILAQLSTGAGVLDAFVVSDNAIDTAANPNEVFVGNNNSDALTTLTLSDVPEPTTTAMLIGAGGLLLASAGWRRLRRAA
ncbi:MAG: PEP-CTERM sorting domain-containing protein [Verrucomicrobia bacterium]|nr:PEP-CTERM sorting domain-containing protein [Verrucomicrobiota bacterium]